MTEPIQTRAELDPEDFETIAGLPGFNHSWAVVIGINNYGGEHATLANAVNDAREVARVLKDEYGFDYVFTLYDQQASREEILSWLRDKLPGQVSPDEATPAVRVGPNDRLVLFFAGHGTTQRSEAGHIRGYLIPQDARRGRYADYVDMSELHDACGWIPAKHILIILDCCFSGVAAIGSMASPASSPYTLTDAYLKRITERKAWQILTAGDKDELAADSGTRLGHSAFTSALLAGLEGIADHNQDKLITATDLANYLKPEVIRQTSRGGREGQSPFFNYLAGSGQGDFVFVRRGDTPIIQPASVIEAEVKPLLKQYPWLLPLAAILLVLLIGLAWVAFRQNREVAALTIAQQTSEAAEVAVVQERATADAASKITATAVANKPPVTQTAEAIKATATIVALEKRETSIAATSQAIAQFQNDLGVPTFTPTNTSVPPTDTPTLELPTDTPIPPTNTFTPRPPTPTLTPVPPTPTPTLPGVLVPAANVRMDITEVTNQQYNDCISNSRCTPAARYGDPFDRDHYPVVGVNWEQAKAYCTWKNGRLPTQKEWQDAARPDGQNYPWGNEAPTCSMAVTRDCQPWQPQAVGSKPAGKTPAGVFDLIGNVWEWTATPGSGRDNIYIVLGGSWDNPDGTPKGNIENFNPSDPNFLLVQGKDYTRNNQGFRCVYDP